MIRIVQNIFAKAAGIWRGWTKAEFCMVR